MLSTLCKDNSSKPEEIPHFQFLKKRVKDFNKLSFQLPSPINALSHHISNGIVKPSTGDCRHRRNFLELQAKELLMTLDPKPMPHPVPRRYNLNAHCRYHTSYGCYNLRHAIQNLIDQQVITLPSLASNLDFV